MCVCPTYDTTYDTTYYICPTYDVKDFLTSFNLERHIMIHLNKKHCISYTCQKSNNKSSTSTCITMV